MNKEIVEVEVALQVLNKRNEELNVLINIIQECMDRCSDEFEYFSFWNKHNHLSKLRRDIHFKRFAAETFLSVRKAEAKVSNFFV